MLSIEESVPAVALDPRPSVKLELEIVDPEVVTELHRHPAGQRREDFACSALRLGVLALRQAKGALDADVVRRQTEDLLVKLESALDGALVEQRERLLREFSLDNRSSALCRLVDEVDSTNGTLHRDLKENIDAVCKEFSLDNGEGALSRLRRELFALVEDMAVTNDQFQYEVRSTLEKMQVRRDEASRSTRHGVEFETALGELLEAGCRSRDEILDACGTRPGRLPRSKKGDFVITLGPESAAAGARIVVEAKEQRYYGVAMALAEIETARRNRGARVGLFVFSKQTAPEGMEPLSRHGQDVLVVWDPYDGASDVFLNTALSLARALSVKQSAEGGPDMDLGEIDDAIVRIGRRAEDLEQVAAWARTIESNGTKIRSKAERVKEELDEQLERLLAQLESLRCGAP